MSTISNTVILLTGCVNPCGMSRTALQDPQVRKQQYLAAIRFYLSNTCIPIVFVENTNTDISSEFSSVDGSKIEFITFSGNDFDKTKGKGYGEALMIEHALKTSLFINKDSIVIKITGRLMIENFEELIREIKSPNCIYANLVRGKYGLERKSYFFCAPSNFLKDYFLPSKDKINDSAGVYFERHLYNMSIEWVKDGGRAKEFKQPILVDGISGSTGKKYSTERNPRIKAWLRYYLHKLPIYSHM